MKMIKYIIYIYKIAKGKKSKCLIFIFILCLSVFAFMYASAAYACLVPTEARKGHQMPWN